MQIKSRTNLLVVVIGLGPLMSLHDHKHIAISNDTIRDVPYVMEGALSADESGHKLDRRQV